MNPSPSIPHLSTDQNAKHLQSRFSKWISLDFLIDADEMQSLLKTLGSYNLVCPFNPEPKTPYLLEHGVFLETYKQFIQQLKSGVSPDYEHLKHHLFMMWLPTLSGVHLKSITEHKHALIFKSPYLEIKPITLTLSSVDQSLRVSVLQKHQPWWGLRCSFPQIVQDPQTLQTQSISQKDHPLGQLYKKLRIWMREHTKPTPFVTDSKKVNLPIRLGKNCFEWIENHPLLKALPLKVAL